MQFDVNVYFFVDCHPFHSYYRICMDREFVIFPFLTQVCISFAGIQFLLKCICQIYSIFLLFLLGPVVTLAERPDPPTNLEMTDQTERSVRLMWIPGDEHNSPTQSKKILEGFYFQ